MIRHQLCIRKCDNESAKNIAANIWQKCYKLGTKAQHDTATGNIWLKKQWEKHLGIKALQFRSCQYALAIIN